VIIPRKKKRSRILFIPFDIQSFHPSPVQKTPDPSSKSPKEKSPKKKSPKKKSPKKKRSPQKRKFKEWEEDNSEEEVEELSEGDKESLKGKDISDDNESFKEKDISDDDVAVGKLPAITQAKKRRSINEDMDADDDKVIPRDSKTTSLWTL
jgi:hypothetical protein